MDEIKFNDNVYKPISVIATPDEIELKGIKAKQCSNNSKLIIENNSEIEIGYVEGVVMVTFDNHTYGVRHVWNKIGESYFDATLEALDMHKTGVPDFSRVYYISNEPHIADLIINPEGIVEFTDDSLDFMSEMVKKFPKRNE